ncbi:MAG: serine/threonine-protein kinase, partial [Myxococcota bacterium]
MASTATNTVIDAGTVLAGTYEVVRLLGKGGMGAVWEARHQRLTNKRVAIKVLHPEVASDRESVLRFQREAQIATDLNHPNIVQVHDINSLPDGSSYLVMEFLEGESLGDRMARGPIPLEQTMAFVRQIGSALAAAHAGGIVHRDLKP